MDDEEVVAEPERITPEQMDNVLGLARRLLDCEPEDLGPVLAAIMALPPRQRSDAITLARYEAEYREERRRVRTTPHRTAIGLLHSFLSPAQQHQLRTNKYFHVRGSSGGVYRLVPRTGVVQRIEKHGSRWYWLVTYCLHDYAEDAADKKRLPSGDLSLQHMLLLQADEPAFLATANISTHHQRLLWDPEWQRILREADERRRAQTRDEPDHRRQVFVCTNATVAA